MPARAQLFVYDLKDKVIIIALERPAIITGLIVEETGPQYRVVYWDNCQRRNEWMYEHELKAAT